LSAYVATTDPGPTNDITQGYSVGSAGLNSTTGIVFICRDNTAGVAVWDRRVQLQAPKVTGNWYWYDFGFWQTAGPLASNQAKLIPVTFEERFTIDQLACGLVSSPTGATGSMAIYASSATGPTGPALGTTVYSTGVTGMIAATLSPNVQVEPGTIYWVGIVSSLSSGVQPQYICTAAGATPTFAMRQGVPALGLLGAGSNNLVGQLPVEWLVFNMVPPNWGTMGNTGQTGGGATAFIAYHVGSIP
jgi:hypothetical protein